MPFEVTSFFLLDLPIRSGKILSTVEPPVLSIPKPPPTSAISTTIRKYHGDDEIPDERV